MSLQAFPELVLLTKVFMAGVKIRVPKKQIKTDKIQIQICFMMAKVLTFEGVPDTRGANSGSPELGSSWSSSFSFSSSNFQTSKPKLFVFALKSKKNN